MYRGYGPKVEQDVGDLLNRLSRASTDVPVVIIGREDHESRTHNYYVV